MDPKKSLVLKLYEINAFKFGDYKMKVGINSPVYFDLRVIVSYPEVMQTISNLVADYMKEHNLVAKHVCGVPYTALPIATIVAVKENIPMIVRRKEAKSYGTKKLIEGIFRLGDTCLIIEDVVTSGSSILDTVRDLKQEGIQVTDAIVVVDREQGGAKNIAEHSIRMHSLFTLSFLMNTGSRVVKYIAEVQIGSDGNFVDNNEKQGKFMIYIKSVVNYGNIKKYYSSRFAKLTLTIYKIDLFSIISVRSDFVRSKISYEVRANLAKCEVTRELFNLMSTKETNLCLAADLTKCAQVLEVADKCGPYICLLKTHIDILEDFNNQFIETLLAIAERHKFLIMEDRKFADIGNTVSLQCGKGLYEIARWADVVTAHTISGRSVLQGLKQSRQSFSKLRGVFLLAEMSVSGNLIDDTYKEASRKVATDGIDIDFVAGIVCQSPDCFAFPGLIQLTPGVNIDDKADKLGQQYNEPEYVIKEKGADIAVVGRGILHAKCIATAAASYRQRLWSAYEDRIAKK
uniref:Uridine 5'-monophosphate synthase n=1 Tax=Glossina palpalis gambiensis TaxID=67801 RepID=A0A1B0BYS8_9MUSC